MTMLAVLDRSLPVTTTSWMRPEAPRVPPGRHVALAPGVLIFRMRVMRASELPDEALTPPERPVRLFDRPDWHERAVCVDSYAAGMSDSDDSYFSEDRKTRVTRANEAKALCRACPVAANCLAHALKAREEFGIWAGTSGLRRLEMFRRIDAGVSTIADEIDQWFAKR